MPFCPQCGASNPEGARFCQACGKPVPSAPAPAAGAGPTGGSAPPAAGYAPPPGSPPGSPPGHAHGPAPGAYGPPPGGYGGQPGMYGGQPGALGGTVRQRNPKTAAAWGLLWGFGAQAFYNGQPLKGVAQIVVNFLFVWKMVQLTGATSGAGAAWFLGLAIAAIFMYDGYRVAQKHNAGVPVGPWTFF